MYQMAIKDLNGIKKHGQEIQHQSHLVVFFTTMAQYIFGTVHMDMTINGHRQANGLEPTKVHRHIMVIFYGVMGYMFIILTVINKHMGDMQAS